MANKGCPFHPRGGEQQYAPKGDEAYSMGVTCNGNTVCDSCAKAIDKGDGANPRLYLDHRRNHIKPLPRIEQVEIVGREGEPIGGWAAMETLFEKQGWKVQRVRRDRDLVETDQHGVTRAFVVVELTRDVE